MNIMQRGIAVAIVQCLLVLSLAGKYAFDRERLPRVWAKAVPVDPNLPMRGRYLSLSLQVEAPLAGQGDWASPAHLSVVQGRLTATPDSEGTVHIAVRFHTTAALVEPVPFFIPEHAPDPSRRPADEELWVEVTVPASGIPRPIRLAVKKNGVLIPIDLQ